MKKAIAIGLIMLAFLAGFVSGVWYVAIDGAVYVEDDYICIEVAGQTWLHDWE